jgi:hypothetical protein
VYEDIIGTSLVEDTGGGSSATWHNIAIYSNLGFCTLAADINTNNGVRSSSPQCGVSSFFSDDNGSNVFRGSVVYGNTLVARANSANCKIWFGNVSSTVNVQNNLLYCPNTSAAFIKASTHDYNTGVLSADNNAGIISVNEYWCRPVLSSIRSNKTVFIDPFIDSSDSVANFRLSSETAYRHLSDGVALSSRYGTDMIGVRRGADGTWERGAYEFNTTSGTRRPNPPTSLVPSVK